MKIRQLEARGRGRNFKPGQVWTVAPELVEPAEEEAVQELSSQSEETRVFAIGDRVLASDNRRVILGTVVRVNPKTLTIETVEGESYRVPPALVRLAVREDTDDVDPDWLEPDVPGDGSELVLQAIEHPTPAIGLGFTVSAKELLSEREWLDVQRLLLEPMLAFNRRTGSRIAVRVGPLEGLNRFNQPDMLVAVWFTFPLQETTEAEVTPLYDGLKSSGIGFVAEGIQPILEPSFPSLLVARPDEVFQVWLSDDPEPVSMSLGFDDDGELGVFGTEVGDCTPIDFLPGLRHTVLIDTEGEVEYA